MEGWARQQRTRFLKWDSTIKPRLSPVRRLATFSNQYPWLWQPAEVEVFFDHIRSNNPNFTVSPGSIRTRCGCSATSSAMAVTAGRRYAGPVRTGAGADPARGQQRRACQRVRLLTRSAFAERGIKLSREQVFRLFTQPPQRLSMDTLASGPPGPACRTNDRRDGRGGRRIDRGGPDVDTGVGDGGARSGGADPGSWRGPLPRRADDPSRKPSRCACIR